MITPSFYTKKVTMSPGYGQFILESLPPSFGQSIGNALRRTLLSSLKGTAITNVKIENIPHQFSTIKGVKETALEIILSLKQVRFKVPGDGKFKITLTKKGTGKITAKDIEGEAEVINKDLYICELTEDKAKIEIEAIVETGYGYILAEEQQGKEFGYIAVDSAFSPVTKVNFKLEEARVGRKTNYDRLILDIWTDASITAEEALKDASVTLTNFFNHILTTEEIQKEAATGSATDQLKKDEIEKKFYDLIIDELNLPSRVVNSLLRENIETVADLIKIGKEKLVGFKGLGKKSIDLIEEELKKLGVEL